MKNCGHHQKTSRRAFLGGIVSGLVLGGCGGAGGGNDAAGTTLRKRTVEERSTVGLIKCESYEEDLFKLLKESLAEVPLPDLSNKSVLIKPNMVEYQPGRPLTTNPQALIAVAQLIDHLGAKEIIIGEGPGHMRDTDFLLESTGLGPACRKLGVPFVDLNLDDLEKVDNQGGLTPARHFYLPKTLMQADVVVSLPKLKTHHWVGFTASQKNLFGTVPGRKYGWPKNPLHWWGIPESIVDLVYVIKPRFAIVDAVVAMEGDGPINGKARAAGFLAVGLDLAAVDATCARAMGIDPLRLRYMQLSRDIVGNVEADRIDIRCAPLASVQKRFELPVTFTSEAGSAMVTEQAG